ncbi:MAG: transferase [Gammaproteobacteria bacterium]|nr:MAG: transferase [Gammaproteobacteria bacterium]
MNNILIIGGGGHSSAVIDALKLNPEVNIVGYVEKNGDLERPPILGVPFLGIDTDLKSIIKSKNIDSISVAVGDNYTRSVLVNYIYQSVSNIKFITVIHPDAVIASGARIGHGTVVMAGCVLNPNCNIGEFCIVNTNSSIDHDSVVGNFSSLAPNSVAGGCTSIGDCTAVGIGATISNNIKIGSNSVIGASSLVLSDVGDNMVVYGSPAKFIRTRELQEVYL